jgi:signal transduction histidine kinase
LLDRHLELLEEHIDLRGIQVIRKYDETIVLHMDQGLADLLIANLLKNAIVHNIDKGNILLEIRDGKLLITNDGPPLQFGQEELFSRFVRDTTKGSNLGLGLSLVKKVCDTYNFFIEHRYDNQQHTFTIDLSG